jgi:mRNA-degrading endonuclease YafQ of YafQ-DinJ toxin-antitoxin module
MRKIFQQNQFKKDLKKIGKSGRYRLKDLLEVVEISAYLNQILLFT